MQVVSEYNDFIKLVHYDAQERTRTKFASITSCSRFLRVLGCHINTKFVIRWSWNDIMLKICGMYYCSVFSPYFFQFPFFSAFYLPILKGVLLYSYSSCSQEARSIQTLLKYLQVGAFAMLLVLFQHPKVCFNYAKVHRLLLYSKFWCLSYCNLWSILP